MVKVTVMPFLILRACNLYTMLLHTSTLIKPYHDQKPMPKLSFWFHASSSESRLRATDRWQIMHVRATSWELGIAAACAIWGSSPVKYSFQM